MPYVPHDPTILIATLDVIADRLGTIAAHLATTETSLGGIAGRGGSSSAPIFTKGGLL